MKRQLEFFAADAMAWREAQQPGTEEKVLSRDADDPAVLTRLVRWVPGLDTSGVGVITHDYVEEVYLLEGELTDLTLGRTFRAGALREPSARHATRPLSHACPAAPCSKSGTASPHDELVGSAVTPSATPGSRCMRAPSLPD
jgi:hypothetical protein